MENIYLTGCKSKQSNQTTISLRFPTSLCVCFFMPCDTVGIRSKEPVVFACLLQQAIMPKSDSTSCLEGLYGVCLPKKSPGAAEIVWTKEATLKTISMSFTLKGDYVMLSLFPWRGISCGRIRAIILKFSFGVTNSTNYTKYTDLKLPHASHMGMSSHMEIFLDAFLETFVCLSVAVTFQIWVISE